MYAYTTQDREVIERRATQFRDQTTRYLNGELSEEVFLPIRLQNGLYVQRHAPMLRIAIPYGMVSSAQLQQLASIADTYDRGYLHVTTRQNVQLNWLKLADVPNILDELAMVNLHAIQTSGNCIRNTTTDAYAGIARDEDVDPRPICELIRQWSTLHPEFAFLPRKFKIAVNGATEDRAAIRFHDIGIQLRQREGDIQFQLYVGGGLGRTPVVGQAVFDWLPIEALLTYLDAILRVYNLNGRRDNKYKARIKILVKALGVDAFQEEVSRQIELQSFDFHSICKTKIGEISQRFSSPSYVGGLDELELAQTLKDTGLRNKRFAHWLTTNVVGHKRPGYRAVTISLKSKNNAPGDITSDQLRLVAELATQFSFSEARMTHQQNIVLADVNGFSLEALFNQLDAAGLATPNIKTANDITCCPGGDFCALANAKSIPVANQIQDLFDDTDYLYDIGELKINISGCMNACGHHHIGDIGILGVDKKGREFYQVSLGGAAASKKATIGKILGPSFSEEEIPLVVQKLIDIYLAKRADGESFYELYHRVGHSAFKEAVYA
ncbi:MAG: nitrite/sulfite reductase [Gammaproteobacteria bacterium]|nr:nitrite/sulfite reductase [Gammaproteobacteria bacterium]